MVVNIQAEREERRRAREAQHGGSGGRRFVAPVQRKGLAKIFGSKTLRSIMDDDVVTSQGKYFACRAGRQSSFFV